MDEIVKFEKWPHIATVGGAVCLISWLNLTSLENK